MKYSYLITAVLISATFTAEAADSCPSGSYALHPGEPCIPKLFYNYLYCLERSGGGKIELVQKGNDSKRNVTEIELNGKGSGVIFSAEAGGKYKTEDINRATREIQEKLDPKLASICSSLASEEEKKDANRLSKKNAETKNQPKSVPGKNGTPDKKPELPQIDSVDFLFDQAGLTNQSLSYLKSLAKRFAQNPDARITLIPEYRNNEQAEQDGLVSLSEQSLRVKRQQAVRKALVEAGFPSERIQFESLQAVIVGSGLRFDSKANSIESGMKVQSWP